jgi:undecaprenyl-diphosphatase
VTPEGHRARLILTVSALAFIVLAVSALVLPPPAAEVALRELLLTLDTGALADVLRAIDTAGTWRVILPGTLLLFALCRQARPHWWIWVVALLAAPAAETFFKFAIGRPRPEDISMGFPSGHATAAAAFFGSVIYLAAPLSRGLRHAAQIMAATCIVLVAAGRVALGAHWPTDSLAGIALGISLASTAYLLAAGTNWSGTGLRRVVSVPGSRRPDQ